MKKRKLFTAGLLTVVIISSCFMFSACGQQEEKENQQTNPSKQEEKTTVEGPVFIAFGSSVMGYWGDGAWHSLDDVLYDPYTAADAPENREGKASVQAYLYQLLAPEKYYLYDITTGAVQTTDKVYIPEQLYLDGLDLEGNPFVDSSFYDTDEVKALFGGYQQQTAVDEYNNTQDYFTLPVTFAEEKLKSFPVPNDLFYLGFLDENEEQILHNSIVLSQEVDGFPNDLEIRADGTAEENTYVQAYLDSVQMGDSDFAAEVWTADVDGDGKQEKLIIAHTPNDIGGYPIIKEEDLANEYAAVFILALLVKEEQTTPLFYHQEPIKKAYEQCLQNNLNYEIAQGEDDGTFIFLGIETCLGLTVDGIFDFNGDGKYEICLGNICWDIPEKRVLELQADGSWRTVLYGSFGW